MHLRVEAIRTAAVIRVASKASGTFDPVGFEPRRLRDKVAGSLIGGAEASVRATE